jgi:hypothetical protein
MDIKELVTRSPQTITYYFREDDDSGACTHHPPSHVCAVAPWGRQLKLKAKFQSDLTYFTFIG